MRKKNYYDVSNALQVGTESEGGYLVPDEYERKLVETLEEENFFRSLATVIQTSNGEQYGYIPVYDREDRNSGGSSRTNRPVNDVLSVLSCHVETVCLLSNRKPDTKVRVDVDLEDYYRIKDEKKNQN